MDGSDLLLAVTTLAASLGGFVLAGFNEARRDRRTSAQERARRADDARLRREEDRHRLQLDALTALQADVQAVARETSRGLTFDLMQARQGKYTHLPEGWSDADLAARQSLALHVARVLDEDVRRAVELFARTTGAVGATPAALQGLTGQALEDASTRQMYTLTAAAVAAQEAVGLALRKELAWAPAEPVSPTPAARRSRRGDTGSPRG